MTSAFHINAQGRTVEHCLDCGPYSRCDCDSHPCDVCDDAMVPESKAEACSICKNDHCCPDCMGIYGIHPICQDCENRLDFDYALAALKRRSARVA